MDPLMVGLFGVIAFVVLIGLGLHIGLAMGLVGIAGIAAIRGISTALSVAALEPYTWASMYSLSVLPLFVLMGFFAFQGGISRDLYDAGYNWIGRMSGGLAMASAATCALFGACSGSSVATSATMGKVALPEMRRYGYDDGLATGTLAASGTLGVMMPPSINAVLYAVTCDQSVGKQLIAGVLPALLITTLFMLMIWVRAKLNPSLGAPAIGITWKESIASTGKILLPVLVFIVMIGGLSIGLFTPTEAGAVGAGVTFLIIVCRRKATWAGVTEALLGATTVVGLCYLILISAGLFSSFLALSGIPSALSDFFIGLHYPNVAIVSLMLLIFLPLGMFIDSISMILLVMPSLYPVIQALGIDAIWFGVLVIAMIEIGLVTPPVGINVYVIKGLAPEVPLEVVFRGVSWFVIMTLVAVAIMIIFPPIATWLPSKML